jgi:EmrB/QacA subfamily drug resistance transporter
MDTDQLPIPHRRLVTVALLLAMAVAALEQLVVSTAMASIVSQLRGFELYSWVVSAFLIAATVTTPIYGKLADRLGRKPVLLFGLALFSLGSALSGLAQSMPQLVAFRVLQGIGAGGTTPIVLTLIGDLYTLRERARVQGLFSAVWGIASLAGPILGGELTDRLSWRWVFFITLPFAALSATVLVVYYREHHLIRAKRRIDWWGAALLAAASSCWLVLALESSRGAWLAPAAATGAVVLTTIFVFEQRRSEEPLIPIEFFTSRPIGSAIVAAFLVGVLIFGFDTFVPLYVQGVHGLSARAAGRTLMPMFLAWSLSVMAAATLVLHLGFRWSAILGAVFLSVGSLWLWWTVRSGDPPFATIPGALLIGLGFGPVGLSQLVSVQQLVPWNRRGVATGAIAYFRTIGGALGVGLFGAMLAAHVEDALGPRGLPDRPVVSNALRPETHDQLPAESLATVRQSLRSGLDRIFLGLAGASVATLCFSTQFLSKAARSPSTKEDATEAEAPLEPAAISLESV